MNVILFQIGPATAPVAAGFQRLASSTPGRWGDFLAMRRFLVERTWQNRTAPETVAIGRDVAPVEEVGREGVERQACIEVERQARVDQVDVAALLRVVVALPHDRSY